MKIFLASIAVFSMFFGAGNLIYPIFIGVKSLDNFSYGIFGLIMSGVLLPLLGLISMSIYNGEIDRFFYKIGQKPGTLLIIIMLAIMGPFAAIPRCVLVSYSGFQLVYQDLNFVYFNAAFCTISGILAASKAKMVDIISKWLTPFLIIGVLVIIIAGFLSTHSILPSQLLASNVINFSIMEGYHTMDMCAAFFFSKIILDYLRNIFGKTSHATKANIISSCIGMAILGVVYACLIFIGAKYSTELITTPKPELLMNMTFYLLGKFAAPIASLTIILACLTTVIALNELVSEWFAKKIKIDIKIMLFIISITSFISATIGFESIAFALGIILQYVYPALISLAFCNIASHFTHKAAKVTAPIFWTSLAVSVFYSF